MARNDPYFSLREIDALYNSPTEVLRGTVIIATKFYEKINHTQDHHQHFHFSTSGIQTPSIYLIILEFYLWE